MSAVISDEAFDVSSPTFEASPSVVTMDIETVQHVKKANIDNNNK